MKKNIVLFILALFIFIPLMSQVDNQQVYQRKIENFSRLRNAGWTMTGFGAGLAITGTILVATLPGGYWGYDDVTYYYGDDPYDEGDDIKAISGIICIGLGVGLLAGGITMGSIGSRKVKQYQKKLDNLSLGMILTPNRQGLTLTYRF